MQTAGFFLLRQWKDSLCNFAAIKLRFNRRGTSFF